MKGFITLHVYSNIQKCFHKSFLTLNFSRSLSQATSLGLSQINFGSFPVLNPSHAVPLCLSHKSHPDQPDHSSLCLQRQTDRRGVCVCFSLCLYVSKDKVALFKRIPTFLTCCIFQWIFLCVNHRKLATGFAVKNKASWGVNIEVQFWRKDTQKAPHGVLMSTRQLLLTHSCNMLLSYIYITQQQNRKGQMLSLKVKCWTLRSL